MRDNTDRPCELHKKTCNYNIIVIIIVIIKIIAIIKIIVIIKSFLLNRETML